MASLSRDFSRTGGAGLAGTGKVPLAVGLVCLVVGRTALPLQEQDREVPGHPAEYVEEMQRGEVDLLV